MRLTGDGPEVAGRQAAALFGLAGVLALAGMATTPGRTGTLAVVVVGDLLCAAAGWFLPWRRWHPGAPGLLCLPGFTVLAIATWAFGGFAAGTGPFFVLLFAWLGLSLPPAAIWPAAPLGLVAYVVPLVATHQPPPVVGSAIILLPVAVGIAVLISAQVRHQHRDRDRIAQMERWRAALSATLAHDLRSPLAAIQLVLEELRGDPEQPQRDAMLAAALRQTGRLSRLSAGLLDVERVDEQGGLRLDLAVVPLRRAVERALVEIDALDTVVVDIPRAVTALADPQRLEQIVVNLVANALRHGRSPVVVSAVGDAATVRMEVRDHGAGVPEGVREALFTRFSGERVGLGLWIVRQLARAHGGEAHYEPAEPGTRMVVTLPAAPPPTQTADQPREPGIVPFLTGTSPTSPVRPTLPP